MRNTGNTGAAAELLVAADLIRQGHEVFRAISPSACCDLVIVAGDSMTRIEVRSANERKDGTLSPCIRESDECDLYAFVCGNRIEYALPDDARADLRVVRGMSGTWRKQLGAP